MLERELREQLEDLSHNDEDCSKLFSLICRMNVRSDPMVRGAGPSLQCMLCKKEGHTYRYRIAD